MGGHSRAGTADAPAPPRRAVVGPHINPATGLATDYLNHFNEAIMLLELVPSVPDCVVDFISWRPLSYGEHFAASHFGDRDNAIAAYQAAEPCARRELDALADMMTLILMTARKVLMTNPSPEIVAAVSRRALAGLKPMIARAGAAINGNLIAEPDGEPVSPQDVVDALLRRGAP